MHWIQKHILITLSTNSSCRYTELIPDGVDGNLFTYHLKQLVSAKLIKKNDDKYTLTSQGKRHVSTISLQTGKEIRFPRIFAMIFYEDKDGQTCLFRWSRQPYLDHISLPFNRVIYGESILETAKETMRFKMGLSGEIVFSGTVSVIVTKNDEASTHYIAHIYTAKDLKNPEETDGLTGSCFYGDIAKYDENDLVYGTKEIIDILKTKKSPFFEEVFIQK